MNTLEKLFTENRKWVYNLSLKMLLHPQEAEDAVQEIFEKAVRGFPRFRGESSPRTWLYRIAKNHLVSCKTGGASITWEPFEADLHDYTPYRGELGLSETEEILYGEEIKVGCTTAMLQCLEPKERIAFVLAVIFQFTGKEAASICDLTEVNFRKILSRAKTRMKNFLSRNCGLVNENAGCRCRKRITHAVKTGRVNPEKLLYATEDRKIRHSLEELNHLDSLSNLYLEHPLIESLISGEGEWTFLN